MDSKIPNIYWVLRKCVFLKHFETYNFSIAFIASFQMCICDVPTSPASSKTVGFFWFTFSKVVLDSVERIVLHVTSAERIKEETMLLALRRAWGWWIWWETMRFGTWVDSRTRGFVGMVWWDHIPDYISIAMYSVQIIFPPVFFFFGGGVDREDSRNEPASRLNNFPPGAVAWQWSWEHILLVLWDVYMIWPWISLRILSIAELNLFEFEIDNNWYYNIT